MYQFIDNKYSRWYFTIVKHRQQHIPSGYGEHHHIVPSSLGGSDGIDNIVKLTAREHFVCHLLLVKMTKGRDRMLMQFAVNFNRHAKNGHVPSSRTYDMMKRWNSQALSKLHSGRRQTEEDRAKKSQAALNMDPEKRARQIASTKSKSAATIERMKMAQRSRAKRACAKCGKVLAVNILARYHDEKCRW